MEKATIKYALHHTRMDAVPLKGQLTDEEGAYVPIYAQTDRQAIEKAQDILGEEYEQVDRFGDKRPVTHVLWRSTWDIANWKRKCPTR